MKLWLSEQDENSDYDTFDKAVVAATDETAARIIHPSGYTYGDEKWGPETRYGCWASSPREVTATYIGEAKEGTEAGVILASFNAG